MTAKFVNSTQAILKRRIATRHNLTMDMRHATATNDTSLTDTKIDKCGVSVFPEAILGLVGVFCEALGELVLHLLAVED